MIALVVVLVVALAALAAGAWSSRRRASTRIGELVARLDPDTMATPTNRLSEVIERLRRAVAHAEAGSAEGAEVVDRMRAALDRMPEGVVLTDGAGRVVFRNASARHFTGTEHTDAFLGDAVNALLRGALAGETRVRTIELVGPPRRVVSITARPVDGSDGHPAAMAMVSDVTERVRLESARTDFVANISHELRTPVGALALLAETIVDEPDEDVVHRLAERMLAEAHRVGQIIEDLLELTRIEHGEQFLRDAISVGGVLAEAVDQKLVLARQRGVEVRLTPPSRRLTMLANRRQLVSAIGNLVENAIKYSDAGSTVDVHAETDGTAVSIVVRDEGIGIPARDLDRIFERFYRVDRARSRETGGTGLGLAIVRHVADNHGGTVRVESHEGLGSTFTLLVPAGPGPVALAGGAIDSAHDREVG